MKWFKHMTHSHRSDGLVVVRERFGMWGLGTWWTICEKVAEQMKGVDMKPLATFDFSELSSLCGCKRNKLETFLRCLRNQSQINYTRNGNILQIEIPKMLEIKDNYHDDLEEHSKRLPI